MKKKSSFTLRNRKKSKGMRKLNITNVIKLIKKLKKSRTQDYPYTLFTKKYDEDSVLDNRYEGSARNSKLIGFLPSVLFEDIVKC